MNPIKPWLMSGVLTLGIGALGVGTAMRPAVGIEETSSWLSNYETAKSVARQTGKPIFLVFR